MTRKDTFFKLIRKNKEFLESIGVKEIGLFGSVVRGEDTAASDIDVLVEFIQEKKTFQRFNMLCDFLEKNLESDFDLVTKESLSPYIGPHIIKEVDFVEITS